MPFDDMLLSGRCGQIVACNLIDSIDLGVVSVAAVRKAVYRARHLSRQDPPRNDREAVGQLAQAIVQTNSYYRARRLPESLKPPKARAARQFKTVIPRWFFVKVFKPTALTRDRTYAYRSINFPDADFPDIEALNGKSDVFIPDALVGKADAPLWIADEHDMRRLNDVDRLRDALGLVHRKANEPLIAVQFSGSLPEKIRRPSALDAGDHRRFRARSDRQVVKNFRRPTTAQTVDEGFTADLKRFCGGARRLDGIREYVCPPVPLPARDTVSWHRLGITTTDAEFDSEDVMDGRFVDKLLRGRKIDLIRRRIKAI